MSAPVLVVIAALSKRKTWDVRPCPFCEGPHSHGPQPGRRLAPCGRGEYVLVSPGSDPEPVALLNAALAADIVDDAELAGRDRRDPAQP